MSCLVQSSKKDMQAGLTHRYIWASWLTIASYHIGREFISFIMPQDKLVQVERI